jgi:hypothetical protein
MIKHTQTKIPKIVFRLIVDFRDKQFILDFSIFRIFQKYYDHCEFPLTQKLAKQHRKTHGVDFSS